MAKKPNANTWNVYVGHSREPWQVEAADEADAIKKVIDREKLKRDPRNFRAVKAKADSSRKANAAGFAE